MKKYIVIIASVIVCISFAACSGNGANKPSGTSGNVFSSTMESKTKNIEDNEDVITGGFVEPESAAISEDMKLLVAKAFENSKEYDGEYTPVAYLAYQIVAGTNHCILCRNTVNGSDPCEVYSLVYIYEDLEGKAVVSDIIQSAVKTDINNMPGGWSLAESPVISIDIQKAFDKAAEVFDTDYKAVALLSEQVVAGMNYCILCKNSVMHPGGALGYYFVYIYVDLEGNVSLENMTKF